jgi:hypothetical protein
MGADQLSYAIGVAKPLSIYVDLHGTGEIDEARLEGVLGAIGVRLAAEMAVGRGAGVDRLVEAEMGADAAGRQVERLLVGEARPRPGAEVGPGLIRARATRPPAGRPIAPARGRNGRRPRCGRRSAC